MTMLTDHEADYLLVRVVRAQRAHDRFHAPDGEFYHLRNTLTRMASYLAKNPSPAAFHLIRQTLENTHRYHQKRRP